MKIPIDLHTHYTSGVASMTYMKAVEAGVDIIDTAMSPFALGTSQPATEVMVETFRGTEYDTGYDQNLLAEIADYFRPIRDEGSGKRTAESKESGCGYQDFAVPGAGRYAFQPDLLSSKSSMRRTNSMRFWRRFRECERILGEPPLVTPSSQIVGTQAVFNVLHGRALQDGYKGDAGMS